jgi:hypothetical protein
MARTTYKTTAEADALIGRIREAHPLTVVSVADAINYALRFTAARDPAIEEVQEMNDKRVAELAEGIYGAVYGDIDSGRFHQDRIIDITDWLTDGEPVTNETINDLARQWRREHTGDDEVVSRTGARDWCEVECWFGALDGRQAILDACTNIWPTEPEANDELADMIVAALR